MLDISTISSSIFIGTNCWKRNCHGMQASILIHNSLLKWTAREEFLPWVYAPTPASGATTAHTGRSKGTLLGKSQGGAGGINPWLNNSSFKAHSGELLLSIKWILLIYYHHVFSHSQIFRCLCFHLAKAKATGGPMKLWVRFVWIKLILFSLCH